MRDGNPDDENVEYRKYEVNINKGHCVGKKKEKKKGKEEKKKFRNLEENKKEKRKQAKTNLSLINQLAKPIS